MDYLQLDFDKTCHILATGPKLSIDEINRKRNQIIERLNILVKTEITLDNFERIMTPRILQNMITIYDELFFDNNIIKLLEKHGCVLNVCFNKRCSKVISIHFNKLLHSNPEFTRTLIFLLLKAFLNTFEDNLISICLHLFL